MSYLYKIHSSLVGPDATSHMTSGLSHMMRTEETPQLVEIILCYLGQLSYGYGLYTGSKNHSLIQEALASDLGNTNLWY